MPTNSPKATPPSRPSDAETVHRLVKDGFFDREVFTDGADFGAKVTTSWHFFNLVRPNRGMEWQSSYQILQTKAPALAGAWLTWSPLILAQRHHLDLPKLHHRGRDPSSIR